MADELVGWYIHQPQTVLFRQGLVQVGDVTQRTKNLQAEAEAVPGGIRHVLDVGARYPLCFAQDLQIELSVDELVLPLGDPFRRDVVGFGGLQLVRLLAVQ